ncbi:MAG: cellulase family glycosylhydrolase [Cyclobacteriaceae bacterium]
MIRKVLYSIFVNATIIGVLAFAAFGFSQVYAWFNTGADRSEILLLESQSINSVYQPALTWHENKEQEGRPLEEATILKVKTDYLASHYYLSRAGLNNQISGLDDYYTEDFRKPLIHTVSSYEDSKQIVNGTTIAHAITPRFYSTDGTLVVLSDEIISYNEITRNGRTVSYYDTASYDVMLLLEDNYWRIRHKVRSENIARFSRVTNDKSKNKVISGSQFVVGGKPFRLKCMNYYPAANPWREMWLNFDEKVIAEDFMELQKLGFNSVRIFVPYTLFGRNNIDREMVEKMRKTLSIAEQSDLKVIVTLFDFFLGYQVEEWTVSDRHAEQIVNALKDHPALFAWDIKNEPDLDFENIGKEKVTAWLDFIVRRIKGYDPVNLVTIGWSQPEISHLLAEEVDFISFHFYRNPAELAVYLKGRKIKNKPLFAGETGMHSYDSWWYPFGKNQADQATYTANILETLAAHQVSYGIWTLHDFKHIPSDVAGRAPWKKNPQKKYGLIDRNGNKKEIYDTVFNYNHNE